MGGGDHSVHGAAGLDDCQYRHSGHGGQPAGGAAESEGGGQQLPAEPGRVCMPVSGWVADRFGTRRVFGIAVAVFTLASVLCGLAINVPMLVGSRVLVGPGTPVQLIVLLARRRASSTRCSSPTWTP